MVKINRVYTKTGDRGKTGLVGGKRIAKSALRVRAYGELDELNSWLGLIRTNFRDTGVVDLSDRLASIQNEIFDLGAELATPPEDLPSVSIDEQSVERLEHWIDEHNKELPELKSFILPGGTMPNAYLHIARAVCRRAEREVCALNEVEPVNPLILTYVNRLSDLLFVMARACGGSQEFLWRPKGKPEGKARN